MPIWSPISPHKVKDRPIGPGGEARHDTCLITGGGSSDHKNGNEQHDEYVSKTQED